MSIEFKMQLSISALFSWSRTFLKQRFSEDIEQVKERDVKEMLKQQIDFPVSLPFALFVAVLFSFASSAERTSPTIRSLFTFHDCCKLCWPLEELLELDLHCFTSLNVFSTFESIPGKRTMIAEESGRFFILSAALVKSSWNSHPFFLFNISDHNSNEGQRRNIEWRRKGPVFVGRL